MLPFFVERLFDFYFRDAIASLIPLDHFLGLLKFCSNVLGIFCFSPSSFFSLISWVSGCHVRDMASCVTVRVADGRMHSMESCAEHAFLQIETPKLQVLHLLPHFPAPPPLPHPHTYPGLISFFRGQKNSFYQVSFLLILV